MSDFSSAPDPTIAQPGFTFAAESARERGDRRGAQEDELLIEEDRADDTADAGEGGANASIDDRLDKAHIEEVDVEHVVERLTEKYSDLPAEVVEETVAEIHESFEDAAVRDFVPRIVEHDANDKLHEIEAEQQEQPDQVNQSDQPDRGA